MEDGTVLQPELRYKGNKTKWQKLNFKSRVFTVIPLLRLFVRVHANRPPVPSPSFFLLEIMFHKVLFKFPFQRGTFFLITYNNKRRHH